jgi:hypothetical protein
MKTALILEFAFLTICLSLTSCTKEIDPPADGLVLYYTFDNNIYDFSGNHNDGIDSTRNHYVHGIRGKALDFNGVSDYIQVSGTINSENGLSFSFWILTRGAFETENNGVIVSKYNMSSHKRCFLVYSFGAYDTRSDNRLSAAFYKYGTSSAYHDHAKSFMELSELSVFPTDPSFWSILNPVRLEKGAWTHCVVNLTSDTLEIWINGALCTRKQREYDTYFSSPSEPLFIGNCPALGAGSNNHFNGFLDELRIYDRGLTNDEIHVLYKHR